MSVWPKLNKPFYFHFRNLNKCNGATVCCIPASIGAKNFNIGIAKCSKSDMYSKKLGRMIAEGRANKSNQSILANDFHELSDRIQDIVDNLK
jgi:hypothetical protein